MEVQLLEGDNSIVVDVNLLKDLCPLTAPSTSFWRRPCLCLHCCLCCVQDSRKIYKNVQDEKGQLPLHDVAEHDPALAPAGRGERASLEKGAANTATTPVEAQLSTSIAPKTVDRASKIPTRPWGVFC